MHFYLLKKRKRSKALLFLTTLCLFLGSAWSLSAQPGYIYSKSTWVFGKGAELKFTQSGSTISTATSVLTTSPAMDQYEGVASYSDRCSGDLLFFTNGVRAWDQSLNTIGGGSISSLSQNSCTQASLIVPMPGSPTKFYVFTNSDITDPSGTYSGRPFSTPTTVNYSIIDMGTTSKGTVVSTGLSLSDGAGTLQGITEKMTAIKSSNGEDYWLIFHRAYDNSSNPTAGSSTFVEYKITRAGICGPTSYNVGSNNIYIESQTNYVPGGPSPYTGYNGSCLGYLKSSPDGQKLAMAIRGSNKVEVFDFNTSTGAISNAVSVPNPTVAGNNIQNPYGLSFSSDNSNLYIASNDYSGGGSGHDRIWTYNLASSTTTLLASSTNAGDYFGALQLGPDGNVYLAWTPTGTLPVSNYAGQYLGEISTSGTFTQSAVSFGSSVVKIGLPNMIENDLDPCSVCQADENTYTPHYSGDIISTNTVWSGKHFVKGIVTVQNAQLDLTDVDVIFAPGAGLVFEGTAKLNAINSTFHPACSEYDAWQGFEFMDQSTGNIEECQFINAEKGVYAHGASLVKITNNLFRNNHYGVYIGSTLESSRNYDQSISGNTFERNRQQIKFLQTSDPCTVAYATDYYGLFIANCGIRQKISQNDFRYTGNTVDSKFYGIEATGASAYISDNQFTNMFRSIDMISNNGYIAIENNKIEAGTNASSAFSDQYQYQINLSNASGGTTDPVLVYGNELHNNVSAQTNVFYTGIYLDHMTNASITQNSIKGFDMSIYATSVATSSISKNKIDDGRTHGIYVINSTNGLSIADNVIKMNYSLGTTSPSIMVTGIAYIVSGSYGTYTSSITGNAILNCNQSVWMSGYVSGVTAVTPLPKFENNFIYNYTHYGLYARNFAASSIGTGTTSFEVSGHNSFISNFKSYASPAYSPIDIDWVKSGATATALTSNGNYFLGTPVAPSVTMNGNNAFHSTAVDGLQIGRSVQLDDETAFQEFISNHYALAKSGNNYQVTDEIYSQIESLKADARKQFVFSILSILNHNDNEQEMDNFYKNISGKNLLEASDKAWFDYTYYKFKGNETSALSTLQAMSPATEAEKNMVAMDIIETQHLIKPSALTSDEFNTVSMIAASEDITSNAARAIVNAVRGGYDYHFEKPQPTESELNTNTQSLDYKDGEITVYPNPASDVVNVMYYLSDVNKADVSISDLAGRIIKSYPVTANGQVMPIDVSSLKTGVYIITLQNENGVVTTQKIIVSHN